MHQEEREMRKARMLGVGIALFVGLIGAVPTTSAAGPPADRVVVIDDVVAVDCGGVEISQAIQGWVGVPSSANVPLFYHLTHVYSNAAGDTWTYMDTGLVRVFERDGVLFASLSGRSINVGPNNTSWVGHWELNIDTGEVVRVGTGFGDLDQRACSALT
jgi:hypothetical protein